MLTSRRVGALAATAILAIAALDRGQQVQQAGRAAVGVLAEAAVASAKRRPS